ncbi:hypothetical protein LUZ63_009327 [Rhynchospora breviuscula]|uniref:Terpene synthase metal-binding domain-containing protein n=1 Tax=Rhynchospora breviuscula TaxID=2022672 RepID=A0A9Q0CFM7_9POAL|nr:hypothetical protein LUZ63_009327 [Rhynchospora breviuscula]
MPYARDRLVECYLWGLGLYFEPQHSRERIMATKYLAFLALLDDIYDVYSTYEDCKFLTQAINRWDEKATNSLPFYLRDFYLKFISTINGLGDELKPSEKYRIQYFIKSIQLSVEGFLQEVEWNTKGQVPSFIESKSASLEKLALNQIVCLPLLGSVEVTEEAFQWLASIPPVVLDISTVARFINDIFTFEREDKASLAPSTLKSYMIEHNLTEQEAVAWYELYIEEAWKRVNQGCLRPTKVATPILQRLVNYIRVIEVDERRFSDGFTNCKNLKEVLSLLLLEPFSL